MTELLSVVLPTYQRPERLRQAARSILGQDYPSIELVVVDDGSSAETAEVLDELTTEDRRVIGLRLDESLGSSGARNAGLAVASGELVAFCDDDDIWLPGSARAAVGASAPAVGVVYGWHEVLHEESGRCVTFRPPGISSPALMRWINVPAILSGVVRRSVVGDALVFDTDLYWSEDWDLWLRCSDQAPMAFVPQALYRYVQHRQVRVTKTADGAQDGHQRFLDKHRSTMTPTCIAHHELAIALGNGDHVIGGDQARQLGAHPTRAGAAGLLAGERMASRLGRRREDPGLSLRFAAAALRRPTHATRVEVPAAAGAVSSRTPEATGPGRSGPGPGPSSEVPRRQSLRRPPIGALWGWAQVVLSRDATEQLVAGSALVLSPHPDDETIGCGLLLAHMAREGNKVAVGLATDGRVGWYSSQPEPEPESIAAIRHDEWHRALDSLGVPEDRRFELGFPDSRLSDFESEAAERIADLLRRLSPSHVFVTARRDPHPDHQALARATRRAVLDVRGTGPPPAVYSFRVYPGEGLWPQGHPGRATLIPTFLQLCRSVVGLLGRRPLRLRAPDSVGAKTAAIRAHQSQRKLLDGELRYVWSTDVELYKPLDLGEPSGAPPTGRTLD